MDRSRFRWVPGLRHVQGWLNRILRWESASLWPYLKYLMEKIKERKYNILHSDPFVSTCSITNVNLFFKKCLIPDSYNFIILLAKTVLHFRLSDRQKQNRAEVTARCRNISAIFFVKAAASFATFAFCGIFCHSIRDHWPFESGVKVLHIVTQGFYPRCS